jgi:hypothetical protein
MDVRIIIMALALLSVLVILSIGVLGMLRGNEFNDKYSNKLMVARVVAQFIAVGLFALLFLFR